MKKHEEADSRSNNDGSQYLDLKLHGDNDYETDITSQMDIDQERAGTSTSGNRNETFDEEYFNFTKDIIPTGSTDLKIPCAVCKTPFPNQFELNRHSVVHTQQHKEHCPSCNALSD